MLLYNKFVHDFTSSSAPSSIYASAYFLQNCPGDLSENRLSFHPSFHPHLQLPSQIPEVQHEEESVGLIGEGVNLPVLDWNLPLSCSAEPILTLKNRELIHFGIFSQRLSEKELIHITLIDS